MCEPTPAFLWTALACYLVALFLVEWGGRTESGRRFFRRLLGLLDGLERRTRGRWWRIPLVPGPRPRGPRP